MQTLCHDLRAEHQSLMDWAAHFTPGQWATRTDFHGWTPWDEIAHLCLLDEAGTQAATNPAAFAQHAQQLRKRRLAGEEISAIARDVYRDLDGPALLRHWDGISQQLVQALQACQPSDRLPWFGPSMSARSFATARLMETWAHGQDVYDALGQDRAATPRLRHIAHLGVSTYGWTFQNRQQPLPGPAPQVLLSGPDGDLWPWNAPSGEHRVQGSALDFCLVVTQRRHVADTGLICHGAGLAWMHWAQCFAGPPCDGPPPGQRQRHAPAR